MTLLADIAWFLFLWTLLSIVVAPIIGRLLKRARRSQSVPLPPLPSGSLRRKAF